VKQRLLDSGDEVLPAASANKTFDRTGRELLRGLGCAMIET
jgi:hypothetical protein